MNDFNADGLTWFMNNLVHVFYWYEGLIAMMLQNFVKLPVVQYGIFTFWGKKFKANFININQFYP